MDTTQQHSRARTGAAIVALVVATTLAAIGGPAGAEEVEADVGVTVTPSTGLLDGHVVTIDATGLTPGERYWMAECDPDGTCNVFQDVGGRPYIPPSSSMVTASSAGTASSRIETYREGCLPSGCTVKVLPLMGGAPLASTPLSFAAEGSYQWPQASLIAAYAGRPVIDRVRVQVAVQGMSPWRKISPHFPGVASIDVCKDDGQLTGADCYRGLDFSNGRLDAAAINGDGTGGGELSLPRHLPNHPDWDCAIDGCVLVVTQDGDDVVVGNPRTNAIPITFAPEWAPFPSAASFVDRAVAGVLGRPPTSTGRTRLLAGLPNRSITGVQALVEAAASSKLDADVGEVVRLYRAYFGRPVETQGLAYWVGRLRSGLTSLPMARAFGGSAEFEARYAGLTNAQAVSLTYTTVLGRDPSPAELQYWRERMQAGLTKADLVYSFARSPENRSRTNRAVWSTIVLFRLTGFAPNAEQLAGGPERAAADALVLSHP